MIDKDMRCETEKKCQMMLDKEMMKMQNNKDLQSDKLEFFMNKKRMMNKTQMEDME